MSGKVTGLSYGPLKLLAWIVMGLALSGCKDGELNLPFLGGDAADQPTIAATGASVTEEDVEAPEIFSVTEEGLWDGRPSLGGVWVAHPDVDEPERVIIRNETTGDFVIGALFRRERDNPGPSLQVSSDAAEELGMIAGAPQILNVVALRRQAVPTTPPIAAPDPDFVAAETVAPEAPAAVTETSLDPIDPGAVATPSVAPEAAPLGAPLDAMADPLASAAAAIAAAEAEQSGTTPAPAPAPTLTSSLAQPYIQIGIFSVEANASEAADRIQREGMSARVVAQQTQGRSFWRVLVGPASTEAARTSALQQVQGLGFTDAYFVAN